MKNKLSVSVCGRALASILFAALCTLAPWSAAVAQGPLRFAYDNLSTPLSSYTNYVNVGVGSPLIDGDKSVFAQRHRVTSTTFAGLENLYFEQFVGEDALLTIGARAIAANNDYNFRIGLDDPDLGYLKTGFRRFTVFYDGSGGFFPLTNQYYQPVSDQLDMNRGDTWVEGGLRLDKLPKVTLKYTRKIRDGKKPSLAWGEATLGSSGMRGIAPAYWKSDEVRNILDGRIEQPMGRSTVGVSFRYEASDNNNARNIQRRPQETQERYVTQNEGYGADLVQARAYTELRVTKKVRLNTSYSFTTLDNDLSGDRITGATFESVYDPQFPGRQYRDYGYLNLAGTSRVKHHIGSANLMVQPLKHLTLIPSGRVEKQSVDGSISYLNTQVQQNLSMATATYAVSSERGLLDVVGNVEARFTGVKRMLLYARADIVKGSGDIVEVQTNPDKGTVDYERDSEDTRRMQKYTAGINWYPLRWMNLGIQAYQKHRNISYEHGANPGDVLRYPSFLTEQDFTTDAANIRIRWRPIKGLSIAHRFDYQHVSIRADAVELNEIQSAEMNRQIISNTVTWSPLSRLFVQGNFNYVLNEMTTPANEATGAAESMVLPSKNDYLNANFTAGFALSQRVDLEGQYFLFRADNYVDNSEKSVPFDSGFRETGLSAGVATQLNDRLRWTMRYIYFLNRDDAFGGNNDYDLQLLYSSVQFQF